MVYAASDLCIDSFELGPFVDLRLKMVHRVDKVVHIGANKALVESKVWIDLLLCEIDRVTILLSELLVCQSFLFLSKSVLSDYDSDPDKIVSLCLG